MGIINVRLMGGKGIFSGKEEKCRAEILSCDKSGSCSYFKQGTCMGVYSPLSSYCKFAKTQTIEGYTSRAMKYHEFREKYTSHEKYNVLKRGPAKLGLIDGVVVFDYPHANVSFDDKVNKYIVSLEYFNSKASYIPLEDFTPGLIYRICNHHPHAMMGGEIYDYQKKIVPKFLSHLMELLPELYEKFINTYSEYKNDINYIGRQAKLATVLPGEVVNESKTYSQFNEKWYWDGEFLKYVSGYIHTPHIAEIDSVCEFKFKPKENAKIVITRNDQVGPDTILID